MAIDLRRLLKRLKPVLDLLLRKAARFSEEEDEEGEGEEETAEAFSTDFFFFNFSSFLLSLTLLWRSNLLANFPPEVVEDVLGLGLADFSKLVCGEALWMEERLLLLPKKFPNFNLLGLLLLPLSLPLFKALPVCGKVWCLICGKFGLGTHTEDLL